MPPPPLFFALRSPCGDRFGTVQLPLVNPQSLSVTLQPLLVALQLSNFFPESLPAEEATSKPPGVPRALVDGSSRLLDGSCYFLAASSWLLLLPGDLLGVLGCSFLGALGWLL